MATKLKNTHKEQNAMNNATPISRPELDVPGASLPARQGGHPFLAWFCLFFACSIIAMFGIAGYFALGEVKSDDVLDEFQAAVQNDYRYDYRYKDAVRRVYSLATYKLSEPQSNALANYLALDGDLFYIAFLGPGEGGVEYRQPTYTGSSTMVVDNGLQQYFDENDDLIRYQLVGNNNVTEFLNNNPPESLLPQGYSLYYCWNGQRLLASDQYKKRYYDYFNFSGDGVHDNRLSGQGILIGVKDNWNQTALNSQGFAASILQDVERLHNIWRQYLLLAVLALVALCLGIWRRRDAKVFTQKIAWVTSKVWLEGKALLFWGAFFFFTAFFFNESLLSFTLSKMIVFFLVYLMLNDLYYNRSQVLLNNSVTRLLRSYRYFAARQPIQKNIHRRLLAFGLTEVVLILWGGLCIFMFWQDWSGGWLWLLGLCGCLVLVVYIRFANKYRCFAYDLGILIEQISAVRSGELTAASTLPPDSELQSAAQDLQEIQQGIDQAVAEQVRSQQMKIDLITNVSHDLKTPLTSIIGYVDLLMKEQDLPAEARDYVQVLNQKSLRLKAMVQDIFDVSKATSGNLDLQLEQLDFPRLIQQTLADMAEQVERSGLTVKVQIEDEPTFILADGNKLYRIMQNLLTNALQYSLPGSRIFVNFRQVEEQAVLQVRNTANYEMSFSGSDVMERFVRGDQARSSEGSGLGLAIVKSFTDACGGQFTISIDADLFTASVSFPMAPARQVKGES